MIIFIDWYIIYLDFFSARLLRYGDLAISLFMGLLFFLLISDELRTLMTDTQPLLNTSNLPFIDQKEDGSQNKNNLWKKRSVLIIVLIQ